MREQSCVISIIWAWHRLVVGMKTWLMNLSFIHFGHKTNTEELYHIKSSHFSLSIKFTSSYLHINCRAENIFVVPRWSYCWLTNMSHFSRCLGTSCLADSPTDSTAQMLPSLEMQGEGWVFLKYFFFIISVSVSVSLHEHRIFSQDNYTFGCLCMVWESFLEVRIYNNINLYKPLIIIFKKVLKARVENYLEKSLPYRLVEKKHFNISSTKDELKGSNCMEKSFSIKLKQPDRPVL